MERYGAEWYRSALNAMHDMVLIKAPDSHLLWANHAFLKYYGMTEAELHHIMDAKHSDPDDTLQYVKDDLTVVESGKPLDIPQEAVTDAAGHSRYFHTIKAPVLQDGDVVRTVGVSRMLDATTIPRRDIDHKDAKAFVAPFRSLAENFPNPMLMVDIRQRVITSSPLWKQQFGDPRLSSESRFAETHIDLPDISTLLDECLDTKQATQGLVRHRGTDGVRRIFSTQISPWKYNDGSIGGATIAATDVSEVHQQAAQLRKANDELTQFSYRASHDLKGPLSTVKGLAKFIQMDIEANDLKDAVENAQRVEQLMEKLEGTVMSFLALARADVSDSEYLDVDLNKVIGNICLGLRHWIQESDVSIRTDLRVQHLFTQDTRITQILENLISNGIKYHDPKAQERFVTVRSHHDEAGLVRLIVEDNGSGIPMDARERVFERFSRFHTKSEGTGLGLAIVKKHVDALNGTISFKGTETGTEFCVTLPRQELEMVS